MVGGIAVDAGTVNDVKLQKRNYAVCCEISLLQKSFQFALFNYREMP
jgi:hypothetical protein